VSAGWSFEDGWLLSYPETSGYLVETFVAAADVLDNVDLIRRANRIIDWELSIQNRDGSFPGHFGEPGSRPVIFNTGQIVHGMVAGYVELGREECLRSAILACEWMARSQDQDGCWRRNVHNDVPHTYNTRAAWAMLRVATLTGDTNLKQSAVRNLNWALTQQADNGWFANNGFTANQIPFTHTIAYAIRGLLESGLLLNEKRFIASAAKAARALMERQRSDGSLAGTFSDGWIPVSSYCCLTGVAQMVLNWQRLAQERLETGVQETVDRALRYLKQHQRILGTGTPDDGALAGSFPIWGRYSRFEFPNWATKFFADALMMELRNIAIPAAIGFRVKDKGMAAADG
jgi:hypothetical protein